MTPDNVDLVIKPTVQCNAKCIYCHSLKPSQILSSYLLSELMKKLGEYTKNKGVSKSLIHWHGGEPMLPGKDFYLSAIDLQQKYLGHLELVNTMQSNLALFTGETRKVIGDLLKHDWIGTCLDPFHETRLLHNGKEYLRECLRGLIAAQQDGFEVGMIYVVHRRSLEVVRELYRFFLNTGVTSVLFHPLEEFPDPEYHLSPARWGEFLRTLWEVWEEDDFSLKISPLADWRAALLEGEPIGMCEYNVRSRKNVLVTVSPEGFLYPCHRFQDRDIHRIGHIADMTFDDVVENPLTHFVADRKENLISDCRSCQFVDLCNSGCVATHDESGKTIWCEGLKYFFGYLTQRLSGQPRSARLDSAHP